MHSNVSHEFFVSLSREDVVKTCFASPIERIRRYDFRGAEERIPQCKPMIGHYR